ncbi:SDR family NAD(P)-dependent oxidoreductase [Saccharopolyspora spinosa]|uniref:Gluconate 5-dehydrogenase/2-deoxy-D-gluconate 3-dehydrogenase n=1 Tax=Saccharopolyspora spinosa TaxID=60894 RepID=A0A2N3Y6R2_SACSN|nr:glucose 1-dehydrogenase [Saccharopolyspora spinosa]PKW18561.1 gluconate 5-dehydrogenase/2-deoxy-D-gluconate 3-dehydrogenase [Saccharopolyspora spinosa]
MSELTGKVAIVTGAAQGLGVGIAHALRAAGARLALVDINGDGLAAAAEEAAGREPGSVEQFVTDLADADQVHRLPERVIERFGALDILVNNAGVRSISPFLVQSPAQWRATLDVNLTAPYLLCQAAIPHMIERGGGKIVNITSTAATLGFKNRSAYNVSKAGLTMLTKSIALELAGSGINCNAVAPGVVRTPLNSSYFDDAEFTRVIVENTPAETWGSPADIGSAVRFLCGPAADFVNGAELLVDGGWCTGKGY